MSGESTRGSRSGLGRSAPPARGTAAASVELVGARAGEPLRPPEKRGIMDTASWLHWISCGIITILVLPDLVEPLLFITLAASPFLVAEAVSLRRAPA